MADILHPLLNFLADWRLAFILNNSSIVSLNLSIIHRTYYRFFCNSISDSNNFVCFSKYDWLHCWNEISKISMISSRVSQRWRTYSSKFWIAFANYDFVAFYMFCTIELMVTLAASILSIVFLILYTMPNICVLLSNYSADRSLSIFLPQRAIFKAHSEQNLLHGWSARK